MPDMCILKFLPTRKLWRHSKWRAVSSLWAFLYVLVKLSSHYKFIQLGNVLYALILFQYVVKIVLLPLFTFESHLLSRAALDKADFICREWRTVVQSDNWLISVIVFVWQENTKYNFNYYVVCGDAHDYFTCKQNCKNILMIFSGKI